MPTKQNIRIQEKCNKMFDRSTMSVVFGETCIKEGLLPKYAIYTYIITMSVRKGRSFHFFFVCFFFVIFFFLVNFEMRDYNFSL